MSNPAIAIVVIISLALGYAIGVIDCYFLSKRYLHDQKNEDDL